jgi:hypothetical protein
MSIQNWLKNYKPPAGLPDPNDSEIASSSSMAKVIASANKEVGCSYKNVPRRGPYTLYYVVYTSEQHLAIAKHALEFGNASASKKYKINESTIRN